jgi:ankyrin repeat protein
MKTKQLNDLPENIKRAIYNNDMQQIAQWQTIENINYADRDKRTAIFFAILTKSTELVAQLLKSKPDLNIKDYKGWYPLHFAAQAYLTDITNLLIEHGAALEVKDDYGNTPLWRATYSSDGRGEMIRLLLKKGANPENENNYGINPLKLASAIANYNVSQFF